MKKHLLTLTLAAIYFQGQAQTKITFEDITIPSASTYLNQQTGDGTYPFTSGTLNFSGEIALGGTYLNKFNVSNITDTADKSYNNSWSVSTGKGHNNSNNYLVTYVELTGANWDIPATLNFTLNTPSKNTPILGGYIANTTWVKDYVAQNFANGDYLKVIFTGYNSGTVSGTPVEITLAEYSNNILYTLNDWQYVDFTPMEDVDSVTVTMTTSDIMAPLYFAMDDITISDGVCQDLDTVYATGIYNTSAIFRWENINNEFGTRFEVAIDESNTAAPDPATIVYPTIDTNYEATGLKSGTNYYLHIRPACWNDTKGNWYKYAFKTNGTSSVNTISKDAIKIYPNPAQNFIRIETPQIATISIFNALGQKVIATSESNINIEALSVGNYIIKVTNTKGETFTTSFNKQ